MRLVGVEIAKMHKADVIHGDLTTSNMMLRRPHSSEPKLSTELVGGLSSQISHLELTVHLIQVMIDFGLAFQSTLTEDKAVDLYVLERAFSSTHPDSEPMFASVLAAYEKQMGKDWGAIKSRLDDGTFHPL